MPSNTLTLESSHLYFWFGSRPFRRADRLFLFFCGPVFHRRSLILQQTASPLGSVYKKVARWQRDTFHVSRTVRQTDGPFSLLPQQQSGELQISWLTQLPARFHLQTRFLSMSSCSLESVHRKSAWLSQVWSWKWFILDWLAGCFLGLYLMWRHQTCRALTFTKVDKSDKQSKVHKDSHTCRTAWWDVLMSAPIHCNNGRG